MKFAAGAVIGLALALTFPPHGATAANLRLATENYPPMNYLENGQIKGVSMDQVRLIMKDADIPYSVEIMPCAQALALAEIEADFCVFTAVHKADRGRKFKWVEPLLKSRTVLVRKRDGALVESVMTLFESTYATACNTSVPDSTIASMQQALNKLIADARSGRFTMPMASRPAAAPQTDSTHQSKLHEVMHDESAPHANPTIAPLKGGVSLVRLGALVCRDVTGLRGEAGIADGVLSTL